MTTANPAVKLTAFAAALALIFVGALAVGGAFGPLRDRDADAAPTHGDAMGEMGGAHGKGGHGAARTVRGLGVEEGGLSIRLATTTAPVGRTQPLRFRTHDGTPRTLAGDLQVVGAFTQEVEA